MPLTFEQQPRESNKAFAAFSLYLNIGAERSTAAVGKQLGKSQGLIERWAAKFDWRSRVAAHAAHLALVEREAIEVTARGKAAEWAKRQETHREDEWQMCQELMTMAREAIARWKKAEHRCGSLEGISRVIDLASKLGRVSSELGLDGERRAGDALPGLRVEVTVALDQIYGAEVSPDAKTIDVQTVPQIPQKT